MTPELQKYAERFVVALERIAKALEQRPGGTEPEPGRKYIGQPTIRMEPGHGKEQSRPKQGARS